MRWGSAEQARRAWYWDPEHNPAPVAALDAYIWTHIAEGAGRARAEAGFAPTDIFLGGDTSLYVNGFNYFGPREPTPDESAKREAANQALRERYGGGIGAYWQQWCRPRAARAVRALLEAAAGEPVERLLDVFGYGYEQTFLMWGIEREPLRDLLRAELGDEGERTAIELTKGFPTATLDADQALWELAQDAAASPGLRQALLDGALGIQSLATLEGGPEFLAAFGRYLDRYGWRTIDWDVSGPTLRERPEAVLDLVRRAFDSASPEPAARVAAAAAEREALIEALEGRFAADPEKLAAFRSRLARQNDYLGVKEDRALWQLSLNGALRHALLRKGEHLVQRGAIDDAADIFHLLPDEFEPVLNGGPADLRALVAERRAARERWRGTTPPRQIGGGAPPAPQAPEALAELKGIGASRGVHTGVARVLASFEEYGRLGAGEVLVCATTTPAWTALFAVAGALVTDGGGMLSHAGVAAREYGLPAVVGVPAATATIQDGQLITVDGTAGIVRIES